KAGEDALRDLLRRAWLAGAHAGYTVHGSSLGVPSTVARAIATAWVDAAFATSEEAVTRYRELLEARDQGLSVDWTRNWANVTAQQHAWAGQDRAAADVAKTVEAQFKEWTRCWASEEHRHWHDELQGVILPIDQPFILPGGPTPALRVYGPRDAAMGPGDVIHCGHALYYHKEVTRQQLHKTITAYRPANGGRKA
ncbi:MAG TPA: hypothetical protein VHN99_07280, partial [Deinococcales bacterium]|nr:hypothetical protein [Deinococcales bacterium]